jgi:hypothetical protein
MLDERCGAIFYIGCMMEVLGLPYLTRTRARQLAAVGLASPREQNHVMVASF